MPKLLEQNILFTLITFAIKGEEKFILNICPSYRGNHVGTFEFNGKVGLCIPYKGITTKWVNQYINEVFVKNKIVITLGGMGKSELFDCKEGVTDLHVTTGFFNDVVEKECLGRYKLSELLCLDSKEKARMWENTLKYCVSNNIDARLLNNLFKSSNIHFENLPINEWLNQYGTAFARGYNQLNQGNEPQIEENQVIRGTRGYEDEPFHVTTTTQDGDFIDIVWDEDPITGRKTARMVENKSNKTPVLNEIQRKRPDYNYMPKGDSMTFSDMISTKQPKRIMDNTPLTPIRTNNIEEIVESKINEAEKDVYADLDKIGLTHSRKAKIVKEYIDKLKDKDGPIE